MAKLRLNHWQHSLLFVSFLIGWVFVIHREYEEAKITKLNFFMPRSYAFLSSLRIDENYSKVRVSDYEHYFKLLSQTFSQRPEAYSLLGFCKYYLGKDDAALDLYQKAKKMEPKMFWYPYNIGVIYYNKGEYEEAIKYLSKEVVKRPFTNNLQIVQNFILQSQKIYWPITKEKGQKDSQPPMTDLKRGYQNAFRMLILSYYRSEKFNEMLEEANRARKMQIAPQGEWAYYAGVASFKLNQMPEAMNYFQEALAKDFRHKTIFYYLNQLFRITNQDDLAKKAFKQYVLSQDEHEEDLFNRSYFDLELY